MMTSSSVLPVGTQLQGRVYSYKIVKVLGQGAFGITYLASTTMPGPLGDIKVQVALKEFFAKDLDSRGEDGSVPQRTVGGISQKYAVAFQHESEKLSKIKHGGIVKVLEAFKANGTYYYSMEYLPCGSLDEMVKGKGMSEAEALPLFKKVAEAVAFMHAHKMMHLDIKPKNIMLDNERQPVLIDFGLSKQYDADGEPESSSTIGLGTPGYAPLEQAYAHSGAAFQAGFDIYALGATLYKMLTGKTPPTAAEILNDGFKDDDLKKKSVSEDTISLIKKAMAPVRKDRFTDVNGFLQAIETLGEPGDGGDSGDDGENTMIFPNLVSTHAPDPKPDTEPVPENSGTVPDPKPVIVTRLNLWTKVFLWIVLLACVGRTLITGLGYQFLTPARIVFLVSSLVEIIGIVLLLRIKPTGLFVFTIGLLLTALFPFISAFSVIWSVCLFVLTWVGLIFQKRVHFRHGGR